MQRQPAFVSICLERESQEANHLGTSPAFFSNSGHHEADATASNENIHYFIVYTVVPEVACLIHFSTFLL